nr:MAG TPA: hypothetical protein [Bacteriophage sp.]
MYFYSAETLVYSSKNDTYIVPNSPAKLTLVPSI